MLHVFTDTKLFPAHYLGFVDPTDFYPYKGIPREDDGKLIPYHSFEQLIEHIEKRRQALNYKPILNLPEIVQEYLYQVGEAPRSLFVTVAPQITADFPRSALKDIRTGVKLAISLSKQALTGLVTTAPSSWVTKQEANERANICRNCPKNVSLSKGLLTRFNNRLADLFTPLRKTDYDSELFDCGVCGCPLQSKVHYSAEIIKKTTSPKISLEKFPRTFLGQKDKKRYACWVRRILELK